MAFAPVPTESRNQINRAGDILRRDSPTREDLLWAIGLADRWRACHAYPINTFQAHLRTKLKLYHKDALAAQRLKRMPTIIDKLTRYRTMGLATMQDIGGVRAIMSSVKDVFGLADEYRNNRRLAHDLIDEKDYINNPRDADGYRSLHLIYKYKNTLAPQYNGLRVEMQIRSKLQHTWATAVETMGTFLGQALKSRQGDQEWLDFFAIVSSAFAHKEGTPPVPRYAHLSREQTFRAVAKADAELRALEKMRGFTVAVNTIAKGKRASQSYYYHLIILNSLKQTVQIKSYARDSFRQAVADYGAVEKQVASGDKVEPVLVSAGPVASLRRAYPNFFLDIADFVRIVSDMVAGIRKR